MSKQTLVKFTLPICGISILSSCSVVPGMHMNTMEMTPTPTKDDQVITPGIIKINASLILSQRKHDQEEREQAAQNYQPPKGYYTDTAKYEYKIGPGDTLSITVFGIPGLGVNQPANSKNTTSNNNELYDYQLRVNKSGNIHFPYVGDVHVSGKSLDEARAVIVKELATQVKNPQIEVKVSDYESRRINILGEVGKPGSTYLTTKPLTIVDAVTLAAPQTCSDLTQVCADLNSIELTQAGHSVTVDLTNLTAPDGSSTNWIVEDGAKITIPNNSKYQVYILGAVGKAGQLRMYNNKMTLREAIGRSAGVQQVSDPGYTYVVRDYQNKPEVYVLNLRSPDALNLAGDFYLRPSDVVFVSTSKLQDVNTVLSQITPPLTTYELIKNSD